MNEIKVEYKIIPKDGERIADIIGLMKKDISWGTFIPKLCSAENSLKKAPVIPNYAPEGSSQNLMGIKFHITAPFRFAYPVSHSKRGFLSGNFRSHETLEQSPLATEFYCSNLPTQHCLLCV